MKHALLFLAFFFTAEEDNKNISKYLQDISVTIDTGHGQGSGVIKTRNGVNYIWTAAHVVAPLRHTRTVVDPKSGIEKKVVEFKDAKVVRELYENSRSVGRITMDAEVLRYSDSENGEDLALLRVRKKEFCKETVKMYDKESVPPIGTNLYHCGSLLGDQGSNSMTSGIISAVGRVFQEKVFDQTTCAAFPGSSGGGIYLTNGEYVGMVVRGSGETFNLIIPIRRIREWADRTNIRFALDDEVPVPTEKELKDTPIEEIGVTFKTLERASHGNH